ncbi:lytic murein transglycosylase [Methylobacterium platani]|uniref:Murein transglycosylase n=2 Tax=Methylobacterium platani TaxID=427683 RepID=A0A179RYM0_9HYPH|nr:lytic murein transglycosylase [Methylobacterium platani]KMO12239.1 murein transglycosylase [Methylobacterium platani JCM 14648]OAS16128.1 murein transglycosylase [Methylobacterium platani]
MRVPIALLWLLAGPAAFAQTSPQVQAPPPAEEPSFSACLPGLVARAKEQGVTAALAEAQLSGLAADPDVAAATGRQAEFEKPVWAYLDSAVSDEAVADGKAKLASEGSRPAIEAAFGVDRHVLVAIWGIESGYGRVLDDPRKVRPVLRSLATLACAGGPRVATWTGELVAALRILDLGRTTPERLTGSWAGAMGHTQFMPTTYLRHGLDFDGDGRADIWTSAPDALASTAQYLRTLSWHPGEAWGGEVRLPEGFDYRLADETTLRPLSGWRALGVTPAGRAIGADADEARLVLPAGARGPAFLLRPNFAALLGYNAAFSYALAVAHLADRLRGEPGFVHPWPREDRPLAADERREIQAALEAKGHPVGGVDGRIGPRSRAAIRAWQAQAGLVPDGYADAGLLERLRAGN